MNCRGIQYTIFILKVEASTINSYGDAWNVCPKTSCFISKEITTNMQLHYNVLQKAKGCANILAANSHLKINTAVPKLRASPTE
jgi:hypothetical protein